MATIFAEHQQWMDANGKPLVGGSLYIGDVDTDPVANPKSIYSDRELTVALANPQTLDANGRTTNKIWTDGKYSLQVNDSSASQVYQDLDRGETASAMNLPAVRGYIEGLEYQTDTGNDTDHDITVTIGAASSDNVVSANRQFMDLTSNITKQLDAVWAAGDDAGGLDTGSIAIDTWYYIFLIYRAATGDVDVLFSTSVGAPTLPTGYEHKRLIGTMETDGSGNIIPFAQKGDETLWESPVESIAATNPGTSAVLATMAVPPGLQVMAKTALRFVDTSAANTSANYIAITSPDVSDIAAGAANFSGVIQAAVTGQIASDSGEFYTRTNTSSQIRYRVTASDANVFVFLNTLGWIWDRGRGS